MLLIIRTRYIRRNNFNTLYILCLAWYPGQNKRITHLSFFHGCRKRRLKDYTYTNTNLHTTLTSEIECDKTAMGLPPITSAVFLIVKQFW
jgi:hypothetical protein